MELYKIKEPRIQPYYHVDKQGNVYSLYKNKTIRLKSSEDKDGYLRVSLQLTNGKRSSFRINRLMALTFLPNPNNYPVVHHINNNKQDNCIDNLEWTTIALNTKYGYEDNDYHFKKKLVAINLLTDERKYFSSLKDCAQYYGVTYYDISKILNKKIKPYKTGKIANLDFMFIE